MRRSAHARWLRLPLVHFLGGGALLFVLLHEPRVPRAAATAPVVLTAADVERLRADYARDTGLPPSADDERALIDHALDDELLFREALARGLDVHDRSVRNWLVEQMRVLDDDRGAGPDELVARARALGLDRSDLVVRRILVQKMRLLAATLGERTPTDAELQAFFDDHRDDYRVPGRVSFWHAFFGAGARAEAERVLDGLRRTGRPAADAARLGDPFPVPAHVVGQAPAQLEKLFGAGFARAVTDAPEHAWVGPVSSAHGVHLVWIEARDATHPASFAEIRSRLVERWRDVERARRVTALLVDLRSRYPVLVESPVWRQARAS